MIGSTDRPKIDPSKTLNMQGAYELAAAVLDDIEGSRVIAIGRFLPMSEITAASPWGVSIELPGGRKSIVWSPSDVDALMTAPPKVKASKSVPRSSVVRPAKKQKQNQNSKRLAPEPAAGWLFGEPV